MTAHMYPHALLPVVVDVDMHACLRIAVDAHQTGPSDRRIQRGQHLAQVGTLRKLRRRLHYAFGGVIEGIAVHRQQR